MHGSQRGSFYKLLCFLLCWHLVNLPSCCSWVQKYIFGSVLGRMFACIQSFSDSLETCCYFWWELLTDDKTEQLQLTTHRLHFVFLRSRQWSIVPKNYWKLACSGCKHTGSKALRFKFADNSQNVVHLFQQQTLRKKIMCNFFLIPEKYLYFKDMKGLWVSI